MNKFASTFLLELLGRCFPRGFRVENSGQTLAAGVGSNLSLAFVFTTLIMQIMHEELAQHYIFVILKIWQKTTMPVILRNLNLRI